MKKLFYHARWGLGLIACMYLVLLGSCQKNDMGDDPDTVLLGDILNNTDYANLPLLGTTWKLVGFVDEKAGKIKLAQPYSDHSYTLVFNEDGLLGGVTSTNESSGMYSVNSEKGGEIEIVSFGPSTYINELYDGSLFIEAMQHVVSFEISASGLILRYEEQHYLLFQPI